MSLFVHSAATAIGTMLVIQTCSAFCNVIGEAIVVEQSQREGDASKFVSLFFGVRATGMILTAYFSGLLIELLDKKTVFLITASFPLLLCGASIIIHEDCELAQNGVKGQLQEILHFVKQPTIYIPIVFILLLMSTPSCIDAMFYFYTEELGFRPEFMGKMRVVWGLGTLLGIFAYNHFLKEVSFKKMIFYSSLLCSAVGFASVLLVTRHNAAIGVPDSAFAVSSVFANQVIGEINIMPILVMSCTLCPKNIEASLYALMMSTLNLGNLIASQTGGLLMLLLGITQDNFDYLWVMVVLVNCLMLLPLPMLLLVPTPEPKQSSV